MIFGIPIEFVFFTLTLLCVAIFHHHTMPVALAGLVVITTYRLFVSGFDAGPGFAGLLGHLEHEALTLSNLALLLLGFELISRHFEFSRIPDLTPRVLPRNWMGGLVFLGFVFLSSGVLDNIATAVLGATIARHLFRGQVGLTYLVAIVAAANAGGAGSVLGDTTTTMMWVEGVNPLRVLPAYVGAIVAFFVFAPYAAWVQNKHAPLIKHVGEDIKPDLPRAIIVALSLGSAVTVNLIAHLSFPQVLEKIPVLGLTLWFVLILLAPWRRPMWGALKEAWPGTVFLLALVLSASLMPVTALPDATWQTTFILGAVSPFFDNIPLTALALEKGGFDWALTAYAVGFAGSITWFGSTAGVAVSNLYPEAKSVVRWMLASWLVPVGYVFGFFTILLLFGWAPNGLMH